MAMESEVTAGSAVAPAIDDQKHIIDIDIVVPIGITTAAVTAVISKHIEDVIDIDHTVTGGVADAIARVIAGIRIDACRTISAIDASEGETGSLRQLEAITCVRTAPSLGFRTLNDITIGGITLERPGEGNTGFRRRIRNTAAIRQAAGTDRETDDVGTTLTTPPCSREGIAQRFGGIDALTGRGNTAGRRGLWTLEVGTDRSITLEVA